MRRNITLLSGNLLHLVHVVETRSTLTTEREPMTKPRFRPMTAAQHAQILAMLKAAGKAAK